MLDQAEVIIQCSQQVLSHAPLTDAQRTDFEVIHDAARKLLSETERGLAAIAAGCSSEECRLIRHQLRNHLNIISGFTRLIVRALPDNLLLHMITIRKILQATEVLQTQINAIN